MNLTYRTRRPHRLLQTLVRPPDIVDETCHSVEPSEEIVIRVQEHDSTVENNHCIGSTGMLNGQLVVLHGFANGRVAKLSGDTEELVVVDRDNNLARNGSALKNGDRK